MDSELPLDAQRSLDAAEGWLGLGDHLSANEELEEIPATLRAHPNVLLVRYRIYGKTLRWEACVDIAEATIKQAPQIAEGWINRSFALHELKRTKEAYESLLPVASKFPDEWPIPYNLACYCCQLGNCEEAEFWFKEAMKVNEEVVKRVAIEDPDLDPLWQSRSDSRWKAI